MIDKLHTFGKFLDQPILISKLQKAMPLIMATGASIAILKDSRDTFSKTQDKKEAKKTVLSHAIVLASAVTSALLAPKIASFITKRAPLDSIENIKKYNNKLIDDFIKQNKPDSEITAILNKAKEKVLSLSETNKLIQKYKNNDFMQKLIPDPVNVKAKDIFSEIGYLSIYGAVPVVGGVAGGIGADIITKEDYKKKIPDKVNEGIYQYLANIFMCNVGAGTALGILEKLGITSKSARAIGMIAGIILTGVLGGSKIANFISQKVLSPIFSPDKKPKERTPELVDLGLHTDDIATVSLLSGLKWIEPALPILYSVSGYRAGIGYRN
ncbi:hypothetical protein IJ531_04425 [bacterium]|nr:hypothetical protein [bacterium]